MTLLHPHKERRWVSWSSKPCWCCSLEEWMRWGCLQLCELLAGCCWVTITNVVATVGENHSWTVKCCSGRTDGVTNLGRALNQPWGAEVSADLPQRMLQLAKGLRTSLCHPPSPCSCTKTLSFGTNPSPAQSVVQRASKEVAEELVLYYQFSLSPETWMLAMRSLSTECPATVR